MGLGRILANRSLNKYRKITESNLKRTQDFIKSNKLAEEKSIKITLECAQYLMINTYDLFVLTYNYLASKKKWDKILYSRIMAMYLIDFYEKIFPLIGKDLILEVNHIAETKTIDSIKIIGKRISKIRSDSEVSLRHIRNVTIAHKSNCGSYLLEQIENINHREIYEFTSELSGLMIDLSSPLTEILNSYAKKKNNGT